jgi:hypothetical protein
MTAGRIVPTIATPCQATRHVALVASLPPEASADTAAEPLLSSDATGKYQGRWQGIQTGFVIEAQWDSGDDVSLATDAAVAAGCSALRDLS